MTFHVCIYYSRTSIIRTPVIRMLNYPDASQCYFRGSTVLKYSVRPLWLLFESGYKTRAVSDRADTVCYNTITSSVDGVTINSWNTSNTHMISQWQVCSMLTRTLIIWTPVIRTLNYPDASQCYFRGSTVLKYSARPLWLLFESSVCFVQHVWRCGYCLRVATKQEQCLIERIQYVTIQ